MGGFVMPAERRKKTFEQLVQSYLMPILVALTLAIIFGIFNMYQQVHANTEFRVKGERFTVTDGKELNVKVDANTEKIANLDGKIDILLEGLKRTNQNIEEANRLNREILQKIEVQQRR